MILLLSLCILLFISPLMAQDNNTFSRYSSQPEITADVMQRINSIPNFRVSNSSTSKQIVKAIDNSTSIYFPPIFNQKGNSCSQASGIRYMFSYHINALRNTPASIQSNVYSYHYTWNFLNQGTDMGSWYFDGYELVMCNGVPSIEDLQDDHFLTNQRTWMTGYDKYYRAMHNRIDSFYKIKADDPDGLEQIKRVLIDQGNNSPVGGVLNFSGKTTGWVIVPYIGSSVTGVKSIITKFGNGGDHAMVFVGFDDDVEFDLNADGQIQDEERGALIVVNSWGTGWADKGKAYMPYKLLKQSYWTGGIGNGDKYVYVIRVKDHTPTVTAKVKLKYTSRNDLWFILGVANDANAQNQQTSKITKIINKQGGDFFMMGGNTESDKVIELGFDYSELLTFYPDAKKFFLTVKQSPVGTLGNGEIISLSIIDSRNINNKQEYNSTQINIPISGSITLAVDAVALSSRNLYTNQAVLTLSPNPINPNQQLSIITGSMTGNGKVSIYNTYGNLIYVIDNVEFDDGTARISIPEILQPSIYFVKICCNNTTLSSKLVIH